MILYRRKNGDPIETVEPVCSADDITRCISAVRDTHIDAAIYKYIVDIVSATRNHPFVALGASPRASIALMRASQSIAFMDGRNAYGELCPSAQNTSHSGGKGQACKRWTCYFRNNESSKTAL